jgi:hypothetical protein
VKTFHFHSLLPRAAATAVAALCLAAPAGAADTPPTGGQQRIVTMTRGMKIFGDAEAALTAALKAKDSATLDRLVAADFEQLAQGAPGTPVPREDWLKQAPADAARSTGIRDMAVHDYGDIAIVSFAWTREPAQASAFVVDVWRRTSPQEAFQLKTRYLSAAPASATHRRAQPAPAPASVDPKR